jgi:hypothetical protein
MPARAASLVALALAILGLAVGGSRAANPSDAGDPADRHVVLIMIDGLRWQEVFRGLDEALATKERGNVADAEALHRTYGGASPSERRAKLMPFLWSTVAREGRFFGNRDEGSKVECTNGRFVSYPGYSETICGIVDPSIEGNAKVVNPNRNVFEALAAKPAFRGRVWAFGCWDVFPFIFGSERNGLYVDDSIGPFAPPAGSPKLSETILTVNRLRRDVPRRWPGSHFDAMLAPIVLEWTRLSRPRALFIAYGETDEWAHETDYARYLDAAHRADASIAELWQLMQSMPEYRNRTTFVITADHGRGATESGLTEWSSHNTRTRGSHEMWLAIIGPGIRPAAAPTDVTIHQAQIAATIARAVGVDWQSEVPTAAPPIDLGPRDHHPTP